MGKRRGSKKHKHISAYIYPISYLIHKDIPRIDEDGFEVDIEKEEFDLCCVVFGCGKKLTLTEKLFGFRCIDHQ